MTVYRRILLVVDLTEDSLILGRRAAALASALEAEIEVLHAAPCDVLAMRVGRS